MRARLAGAVLAATALATGASSCGATSQSSPASYLGAALSVQAPGAVPAGATATASELLAATPVLVHWKVTNVGGTSGTPFSCAIAIRVPNVSGFGLQVLAVGQLRPGASQTGTSSIAPIGAFPPGLWAGHVGAPDVTVGCK